MWRGGSVAAAGLSFGGVWLMSAPATAAPTTKRFNFTGKAETVEVPANVCQITVDARGAQGGAGQENGEGAKGKVPSVVAPLPRCP